MYWFHEPFFSERCGRRRGLHCCHSRTFWGTTSHRLYEAGSLGTWLGVRWERRLQRSWHLWKGEWKPPARATSSGACQARTRSQLFLENAGRTEFSLMENKMGPELSSIRITASALALAAPSSFHGHFVCMFYHHNSVIY